MAEVHTGHPYKTIQTFYGGCEAEKWSPCDRTLPQYREHAGMLGTRKAGLSFPSQQPQKKTEVHLGNDRNARFSGGHQYNGPQQTGKGFSRGGKSTGAGGI